MIYIKNNNTDPYFNLASEEYILKKFNDNVTMLWQNKETVVLGKNQNAYAEINLDYIAKHNITVTRRLTGGGCVFHDLGNINFSFIYNVSADKRENILNFKYFTEPIIYALQNLGVNAEFQGRNDLLIDGMKFSGNAQCLYKTDDGLRLGNMTEKILHHGTLLFNADMSHLAGALNVDAEKIKSKGIKSVKSRVTNVYSHLPAGNKMQTKEFMQYLEDYIIAKNNCDVINFSESDVKEIQELADNKYKSREFLYDSPIKYFFKKKSYFEFGTVEIYFNAEKSKIKDLKICGDFFGEINIGELEDYLNGTAHNIDALSGKLAEIDMNLYINGADTEKILKMFI